VRWAWLHHRTYRLDAWRTFFAPGKGAGVPDFAAMARSTATRSQKDWIDARDAFKSYVYDARLGARLLRTTGASLVYLAFGFGIFFLCGVPVKPARNIATWRIDFVCLFASVLAFNCLVFYVVDTTLVTRRLLKRLAEKRTAWPAWVVRREADALGLKEVAEGGTGPEPRLADAMEGLIDVQYASRHTEDLGGRFYLPFLVMLLMIVSRSRLFDNWGWPLSMILINVFGLMLVAACAFLSRRAARKVRDQALEHLDPHIVAARGRGRSGGRRPNLADLESIREAIMGVRRGAYARIFYDPAFLSILIPTVGYGVFVLLCQYVLGIH